MESVVHEALDGLREVVGLGPTGKNPVTGMEAILRELLKIIDQVRADNARLEKEVDTLKSDLKATRTELEEAWNKGAFYQAKFEGLPRDYVKELEAMGPFLSCDGPLTQEDAKAVIEAHERSLADPEYGQAEWRAWVAKMDERRVLVEGAVGGCEAVAEVPKCDYCGDPANGHHGQGTWDCGNCDKGQKK